MKIKNSNSSFDTRIFLKSFPTKVIYDYNPEEVDETDGNVFFPMDDLEGAPTKINSEEKPNSIYQAKSLATCGVSINKSKVTDSDLKLTTQTITRNLNQCPMGVREACNEIETLKRKYYATNQCKKIETRTLEGVVTCYIKIWDEIRRRASMGLNYLIFFVYNKSVVEKVEKLLTCDSFIVLQLPCKGDEAARLYIAFDVTTQDSEIQYSTSN